MSGEDRIARPGAAPTFALALGGGGARGLAHIHVIEALDELGIRPVAIAGSSIGAIMGAGMAAGMRGSDIRDFTRSIFKKRTEIASRIWRSRSPSFGEFVRRGFNMTQFNIERILTSFLPEQFPETFEELKTPLKVTATDFYGHRLHVIDSGELRSALAASAALPAIFEPVRRDGRLLIDGGFYNPVPWDLIQDAADIVLAIDVVGAPEPTRTRGPSAVDLLYGASQLMMQSVIAAKLHQSAPDILLRPPVSRFRVLDFLKIDSVLAETAVLKDEVKRSVDAALEKRANDY